MLNKARKKFIIWAMVAMTVVVATLIAAMNIVNWRYTESKLDEALSEIVDFRNQPLDGGQDNLKKGILKKDMEKQGEWNEDFQMKHPGGQGRGRDSALNQYAGRLSVLLLSDNSELEELMQDHELLTEEAANELIEIITRTGKSMGYYDDFKYTMVLDRNRGKNTIYALDCSVDLGAVTSMVWISVAVGLVGLILALLFILKMSSIAVAPVKESIEKQKQFITNAGHELKTPLSAISTNMDILSMDLENNEWVEGTKRQVHRLRKLVESLVSLSKMEEEENAPELQNFNFSRLAEECIDGFAGLAEVNGKTIKTEITPDLKAYGDVSITQQLVGILCDNAIKYSVGKAPIEFRLYADKKNVCFQSINEWDKNVDEDKLDSLFERFFRGDSSRSNNEKNVGYGLGLSIARAMAEKNHGSIGVKTDNQGRIIFTTTLKMV